MTEGERALALGRPVSVSVSAEPGEGDGDRDGEEESEGKGLAVGVSAVEARWSEISRRMQMDMETFSKQQGDRAGKDCSALRSVSLPYNVTSIGSSVFLRTAFYKDNNQWDNGALYLNNCLIDFRSGLTDSYEIKPGTRCVGGMAFFCSKLTRVIIPEGVISIGNSAFEKCRGLTSVTIPDGVPSIGYRAFEDCNCLTSVAIPASVTSISNCAFRGCTSLTIHAPVGSYAEQYAKDNNIPFVAE